MKVIVKENERGLKFKKGRFVKLLMPGRYYTVGDTEIETVELDRILETESCSLKVLLENPELNEAVTTVEVLDGQLALHYVDGKFSGVVRSGRHAFFKASGEHKFTIVDITTPEVSPEIPEYIFTKISPVFFTRVEVSEYQKARLYFNSRFVRLLDPGVYYFWKNEVAVRAEAVDTRLLKLDISGQEMLTQDKVTLRINFVLTYKIADYVKVASEIDNYLDQLHMHSQLALRDYVGKNKLDDILENKQAISEVVFSSLKAREAELYLDIRSADLKDIILPGEIRDIMNTVLVAEKKAQANVITRREEVASTRSLLNTAKLMEENPTLYRLKELEYVERICENVGNINVAGTDGLLSELSNILRGGKE